MRPHLTSINPQLLHQLSQVRTAPGRDYLCARVRAYWGPILARTELGLGAATANRVVCDFPDRHTAPPVAPDGPRRARHTPDHTRQPFLRRRGARILRVSIFGTVAVFTIPYRRPACSPHGNIHATSATRLGRPPVGFAGSPY